MHVTQIKKKDKSAKRIEYHNEQKNGATWYVRKRRQISSEAVAAH